MMERLQNKFKDLAESDDDPSVEVLAKEHALRQTETKTLNARKDKGKCKVSEPPQESAPKPPWKDISLISQPSRTQKATSAFEPRHHFAPRGKVVPKGQSTMVPKSKGWKNHPNDSVNQDGRTNDGHSEGSWSTVDLCRRLDARKKGGKSFSSSYNITAYTPCSTSASCGSITRTRTWNPISSQTHPTSNGQTCCHDLQWAVSCRKHKKLVEKILKISGREGSMRVGAVSSIMPQDDESAYHLHRG
uniref:Uncharacterized protein n=1 Tax=Cannabis sativa TaxID=3483 RepID=A0A803Q776_CANSA